ncbi:hypothetical protein WA171_003638, partial [Blastocystis sp. BT1]
MVRRSPRKTIPKRFSHSIPIPEAITFTILTPSITQRISTYIETPVSVPSSTNQETAESSPSSSEPTHSSTSGSDGSGEEESWNQKRSISKKICLSCGTKKTPRWHKSRFLCDRPHELFCNACAIRIKKYHLICAYCHFALNRDQASHGSCPHCHHRFINLIDES